MTRPLLVTKYRGTGQTECEVFQSINGTLTSLFTYGTAGVQTSVNFKPGSLAVHWRGAIYAIAPEEGIYKNTPPETSGVLLHSFTSPSTTASSFCMDWQTIFKYGKSQLFTLFLTSTSNNIRMVFIDEEDNVTETSNIVISSPALNMSYMRGLNVSNKIYTSSQTSSNLDLQITDPISESIQQINWAGVTYAQSDLALHSGIVYGYTQQSSATIGLGNALWNLSSAVPYKLLEWNGYLSTGASAVGQCCVFSDGDNLITIGVGSGVTLDEFDVWKVSFDVNGTAAGITSVRDLTLGFSIMNEADEARYYVTRDIESDIGEIETEIHMVTQNSSVEGNVMHHYRWNGANSIATYLGVGMDSFTFDAPSYKIGGGARTFSNENELNFTITDVAPTGSSVDITYVIDGSAPASGVAMSIRFNNLKDSPLDVATVTPIDNGSTSGNYIIGLSTGESGIFRWDIATDRISTSDTPNISATLFRT